MSVIVTSATMGPNIITDGLVLYLDAANSQSYPGSGTVWYDLSEQKRNVTGYIPTFISNGPLSYWEFPDTDNQRFVGSGGSGTFINGLTVDIWFYSYTGAITPSSMGLFEKISSGIDQNRMWLDSAANYCRVQPGWYGDGTFSSTNTFVDYQWENVILTYYNNGGVGKMDWYRNGQYLNYGNDDQSYNYGNISNSFYIGTIQTNSYKFKGRIAIVKQYNRNLSSTEILQNYNALKNRFI